MRSTPVQLGDIIVFDRSLFYHYGIYVGNDEIVHLNGSDKFTAVVKKENIWNVAGSSKIYLGNRDNIRRPFLPQEVVKRALSKLGVGGYNLITFNCEHFANWCRYGVLESLQINHAASSLQIVSSCLSPTGTDILLDIATAIVLR